MGAGMDMVMVLGWAVVFVVVCVLVYWGVRIYEYIRCVHFKDQVPFEASSRALRRAVADEINAHYSNMRTVCEIGGGYGGMARYIARKCNMDVTSMENMPFTCAVAHVADFFSMSRSRTVRCDAFARLGAGEKYDIGVAYMGPWINPGLGKYSKNFRVLITIDVPIDGIRPRRVIDLGHGFTIYAGRKYPNKLFVYEF